MAKTTTETLSASDPELRADIARLDATPARPPFLDRIGAGAYAGELRGCAPLSLGSMELLAHRRTGPKFVMVNGRAAYKREWVQAWVLASLRAAQAGPVAKPAPATPARPARGKDRVAA